MVKEMQETKGSFKLVGTVNRLHDEKAFKEDEREYKGETTPYRTLRFGVKTSEDNEVTVQAFSYLPKEAFLWNSDKKKKSSSYRGDRVPFGKWAKNKEQYREKGYTALNSRFGLVGENGKTVSNGEMLWDTMELIVNNLKDGDLVVVKGNISYNTYEDKSGNERLSKNFNIESVVQIKERKSDEEVSYYQQPVIFDYSHKDEDDKIVEVGGIAVNYRGEMSPVALVVNYGDDEGDEKRGKVLSKLATAFEKKVSRGDELVVYGKIVNKAVKVEEEDGVDDEDIEDVFGTGLDEPAGVETNVYTQYVSEMQIHGVREWERGKYTDEDLDGEDLDDEIGGADIFDMDDDEEDDNPLTSNKKVDNPLIEDDEITDDDLPF